ncbi:MAG TPA: ABC transporter ATP-binding protein [Marmoricola sp.]|nr:ABC transporter ATP-binding protein [Marmoricola sp.]
MGVQLDGTVGRGGFRARLAVDVADGEVVGVLGPNGAGKSTLLRTLAGLLPLAEGNLRLGGRLLDDPGAGLFVQPEERPVGMVFQDYRLFPHLDVLDNVAFAARCRGLTRRAARAEASGWVERLGLSGLAHRRPHEVSGGQAQRVALARALARDPQLLLLDEPLAALDTRTRLEVRAELRRHLADFPGPTVLVTHDPLEAMVMTDRLLVLEDGRVVQDATPVEVARRPATPFVARLVGLNLYAGELDPETAVVHLDGGGTLVAASDRGTGGRVLVGLRPSAITLHVTRPDRASTRNAWPGTVTALELLGDRVRVQVDGAPPALVDVTAGAVAELGIEPGMPVWLTAKATETDAYPDVATLPA